MGARARERPARTSSTASSGSRCTRRSRSSCGARAATLRRYAHVGTGNYNTRSGRQYTDLSLFSASDALTCDVADLFNALTGSARPPEGLARGALVAPVQLLPAVLELIERETRARARGQAGAESRSR